jgi:hypothetical protein
MGRDRNGRATGGRAAEGKIVLLLVIVLVLETPRLGFRLRRENENE